MVKKLLLVPFFAFLMLLVSGNTVQAATVRLEPNGDSSVGSYWTTIPTLYDNITQPGVTNPSTPSTSAPIEGLFYAGYGDHTTPDLQYIANMTTQSGVASVSAITVNIYAKSDYCMGEPSGIADVWGLLNVSGSAVTAYSAFTITDSYSWNTVTFSGLSLSQTDLDNLEIVLGIEPDYAFGCFDTVSVAQMYAVATYTAGGDSTAPAVEMTAPSDSTTVSGASVTVSASSSDAVGVSGVKFNLDNSSTIGSEDTSAPYSISWDSTGAADGSHTLRAVARDAAGNIATSTAVTVTVDNTAPVRSAGAPSGTLALNTSTTTISLSTNETATCKYSTSAATAYGSMTSFTTTAGTSHSSAITGLTNGTSSTYYVKCADGQSNVNGTEYTISFSVAADTTAPSVSITAPSNAATVSGASVSITASASDDVGVSGVQFLRGTATTTIGSEDTTSTYGVTWDTTGLSDGAFTLFAVARDAAGNYATSSSISVTVDNTAPVRSAGSPSGTLAINTTSTSMSLTTDETATCKYSTASATAYGSMTAFTTTAGTSHSSTISGLTNGTSSTYYVKCADSQSNTNATNYSITFSVAADTTGPTVSMTAPSNAATVSGSSVSLTASASDDVAVSGVQFYRGTATTTIGSEDTTSTYGVTWDTTAIADGSYTLFAVGRDSSSNYSTSSSISVTVDNTGPLISSVSGGTPTSGGTTITWTTNESSDSQVTYGTTDAYGAATTLDATLATSHSVSLSSLSANTTYHFQVISNDAQGNASTSVDATFTTAAASSASTPTTSAPQTSAGGSGGLSGPIAPRFIPAPVVPRAPIIPSTPPKPSVPLPTKNLEFDMIDPQVKFLQQYLNTHGFPIASKGVGSLGRETNYFGPATRAALIRFQKAKGIKPAVGYMGPVTRGYLK